MSIENERYIQLPDEHRIEVIKSSSFKEAHDIADLLLSIKTTQLCQEHVLVQLYEEVKIYNIIEAEIKKYMEFVEDREVDRLKTFFPNFNNRYLTNALYVLLKKGQNRYNINEEDMKRFEELIQKMVVAEWQFRYLEFELCRIANPERVRSQIKWTVDDKKNKDRKNR